MILNYLSIEGSYGERRDSLFFPVVIEKFWILRMSWHLLKQALDRYHFFLIFMHRDPDGDAIGSSAALWRLLQGLGKSAKVVVESPLPSGYEKIMPLDALVTTNFLSGHVSLALPDEWRAIYLDIPEAIFALWVDFQDALRLGHLIEFFEKKEPVQGNRGVLGPGDLAEVSVGIIDHHTPRDVETLSPFHVIEPQASSCGVLVYQLFHLMNQPLDLESATALYWSVASDTVQFSLPSTRSLDLEVAAECLRLGVTPSTLQEALSERFELELVYHTLAILKESEKSYGGRCVIFTLTKELMKGFGTRLLRFIHQLMPKLSEPQVWLVVLQESEKVWRFSARSRESLDLGVFFQRFGGGGHSQAAGTASTIDRNTIIEAFKNYIAQSIS